MILSIRAVPPCGVSLLRIRHPPTLPRYLDKRAYLVSFDRVDQQLKGVCTSAQPELQGKPNHCV